MSQIDRAIDLYLASYRDSSTTLPDMQDILARLIIERINNDDDTIYTVDSLVEEAYKICTNVMYIREMKDNPETEVKLFLVIKGISSASGIASLEGIVGSYANGIGYNLSYDQFINKLYSAIKEDSELIKGLDSIEHDVFDVVDMINRQVMTTSIDGLNKLIEDVEEVLYNKKIVENKCWLKIVTSQLISYNGYSVNEEEFLEYLCKYVLSNFSNEEPTEGITFTNIFKEAMSKFTN